MSRNTALMGVLAALIVGAVGLSLYWFLAIVPPHVPPPDLGPARPRASVPVPSVPFTDVTTASGIAFKHFNGLSGRKLLPETMGGGVAALDFDGDGHQDLLFVNGMPWPGFAHQGPVPTPVLYRNKGDGTFEDVTEKVGLNVPLFGMGVTVGDFDNDGHPDVFISCIGRSRLFRNDGGKHFLDVTDAAGVGGGVDLPKVSFDEFVKWSGPIPFGASCSFLDYDGDGRLDLFVCYYVTWSPKIDLSIESSLRGGKRDFVQPRDFDGAQCRLYRNVDGKKFEDVSESAGVFVSEKEGIGPNARVRPVGKALGVAVFDADGDGYPDVLVACDTVRNLFFHNVAGPDGKRRFKEKAHDVLAAYADEGRPRGGMGIDWGEYAPGRFAAVIANFANEPNTFLRLEGRKPLQFSDAALAVCLAGPSRVPLKFGAVFLDYDLDGRLDLLTNNGHIEPEIADIQATQAYAQPPQLFWNTGEAERLYEPATGKDAGDDLFKPLVGRGCAFLDVDGDGDLDVVLVGNGGPARLLRNDQKGSNRWVRLELKGDGTRSNRSAIGAVVTIEAGGRTLVRQVTAGRGYLSQSELPLTVGLGTAAKADRVRVRWPGRDDKEETWEGLEAGKRHTLEQGKGK